MKSCNLVSAVIYLEKMHTQLLAEGNVEAAELFDDLVKEISDARNDIVNKSALAGAGSHDIHIDYAKILSEKGYRKSENSKTTKQQEEPTYETVAGFTIGEVKEVEMTELLDVVGEIATHADTNRFGKAATSSKEDIDSIIKLLKAHLSNSGRRIEVELTNQVIAKLKDGTEREALGKVNRKTGVMSIALSPSNEKLSTAALLVSTGKVVLHELVHAMTVQTLSDNKELDDKVDFLRKHAISVYKAANGGKEPSYEPGSATYGLKNTEEFVAEVITSRELQKLLAGMNPTKTRNIVSRVKAIFNKIVAEVKASMGIVEDSYTLLDEAVEAVTAVLDNDLESLTENEQEVVDTVVGTTSTTSTVKEEEAAPEGYKFKKEGTTFTTNTGQTSAINVMKKWYKGKDPKKPHFLLQGRGGTGKTTVINVLLEELGVKPSGVMFAAFMHKASTVLAEANSDTKYKSSEYTTIASILGLRPTADGNFEPAYGVEPKELPKVLVVDEVSMLRSDHYKGLVDLAAQYGTHIIFMGDHAQLPPVNDPDPKAKVKSVVFKNQEHSTTHLNELMRQGKDSPIITTTDSIIGLVNYVEDSANNLTDVEFAVNKQFRFDGNWFNKYDETTGEGVSVTKDGFNNVLPHIVNDLKEDLSGTKFIHYNNHVHKSTINKIDTIRDMLFNNAEEDLYIKGEPLILNGPYTVFDTEEDPILNNAEEFVVVDSTKVSKDINYKVNGKHYRTTASIDMYEITAYSKSRDSEFTFYKPVEREGKDVDALIKRLMKQEGPKIPKSKYGKDLSWLAENALRTYLATELSHAYVINTHKSQGSSYSNVYMDAGNILGVGPEFVDANNKAKSLYVGASRAKKRLVVIDNRNNGSVDNGVSMEDIPLFNYSVSGVNTVEATKIIDEVTDCKGTGN